MAFLHMQIDRIFCKIYKLKSNIEASSLSQMSELAHQPLMHHPYSAFSLSYRWKICTPSLFLEFTAKFIAKNKMCI